MTTIRSSGTERTENDSRLHFEQGQHNSPQTPLLARKGAYMTVHDIMTAHVITVDSHASLPEIRAILTENAFRHVLVREHNRIIGVITDRDIRRALPSDATSLAKWEIPLLLENTKAKELMHSPVITVLEDAPMQYAARVMLEEGISCLPVLYGDELKGIVTSSDILRAVAQS